MLDGIIETLQRPTYPGLLWTHVQLSVLGTLLGILISVPVALAVRNTPLGAAIAVNVGNLGRAIPSLALLAIVFPFLGFGFAAPLIALTALATTCTAEVRTPAKITGTAIGSWMRVRI